MVIDTVTLLHGVERATTSTNAMSTSVGSSTAGYAIVATHVLFSIIEIMINVMFINPVALRSQVHMFDVTNILLILFWIKLVAKLLNFLTIQKPDRHFSVVGFVGMLKPNVFEGTHYKRWRQRCILWLTAMHCYFVAEPRSVGPHIPKECVF